MRISERAWCADFAAEVAGAESRRSRPVDLAHAARSLGYSDAVPTKTGVTVFSDSPPDWEQILAMAAASPAESTAHRVEVHYDGPDLSEAAERLGLSVAELVRSHTAQSYECVAVGFQPGFAYLGDLPDMIGRLPRRASPRAHVPSGTVAIAGRQTAIYPGDSPGGWWLIGRTTWPVRDAETRIGHIAVGDTVQFSEISDPEARHPND
ncbi:MAG: carboxyltransferase domain-containing protein [Fimbriimonadaceae bacterium]|nr:carboxyltransferase domain-containing protein [Fimbriimonadaceae bacterium]